MFPSKLDLSVSLFGTLSTHQSLTFLMLKDIKWGVTNESLLDDGNPVIGRVTDTHQIKN